MVEIISNEPATFFHEKNILSVREACLFMDISQSYLYKLTHGRLLRYFCPNGKKIYFRKDDLESWMMSSPRASKDEIKQIARNYIFQNKK